MIDHRTQPSVTQSFYGRIVAASQSGGPASCQAYDGSEGDRRSSESPPVLDRGPGLQPTTSELTTAGVAWGTVDQAGVVRTKLSSVLRAAEAMKAEAPSSAEASPALLSEHWREPEESGVGPSGPSLDTSAGHLCKRAKPGRKKGARKRGKPGKGAPVGPPDPATEIELPGVGEVLPEGLDLYRVMVPRPHGTYHMSQEEYRSWLAETYRHAARWARKVLGAEHGLTKLLSTRAESVEDCGKVWAVKTCEHCGHEEGRKAFVLNACDSTGCPICGRTKAQPWRAAAFEYVEQHPAMRRKGQVSRIYHLDTYTLPVPEVVSIATFKEQFGRVRKGVKNVWRKVARFLPRPKNGEYGAYPGVCEDAGMLMGIEIGPSANLHAHVLRYGAGHRYEDLRTAYQEKVPDAQVIDHKVIKGKGGELAGGVAEVLKYAVQSSMGERGEFTHPLVVVLSEIALYQRRRIEPYGSMRGMKKRAEELRRKHRAEAEIEGTTLDEPCSCCGHNEWKWANIERPRYWVPEGWSGRRKRGPPEGCET